MSFIRKHYQKAILLIVSAGVLLLVVWPLFHPGFPDNHDKNLYMNWLSEFDRGIKDGQLLPRWAPNVWLGYGSPLFNFSQPLFFYVAELFRFLGANLVSSVKLALIVITAGGFWFMYLFARQFFGRRGGLLSATAFSLAPYHLGLIYNRGALSEYLAMTLVPLVFYGFWKLKLGASYWNFALASLSLAALILAHNISIILFLPPLFIFLILFSDRHRKVVLRQAGALVAGFLLSAFFWLPAFFERSLIKLDNLYTGPYDFHRNFSTFKEIFFSNFWDNGPIFQQVSFVSSALLIVGIVLVVKNWRRISSSRPAGYFLLISLIAIAFTTSLTRIIWENIGLLKYTQFPYRFLSLVDFGTALLAGLCVWPEPQRVFTWIFHRILPGKKYSFSWVTAALMLLLLWFSVPFLGPQRGYLPALSDPQYTPAGEIVNQLLTSDELVTFAVKTAIFPRDNDLDKLQKRVVDVLSRVRAEVLTGQPAVFPKSEVIHGQATVSSLTLRSTRQEYSVASSGSSRVRINTFFFPGWQAKIDGRLAAIDVDLDYGLMEFDITDGTHKLVLEFKNTPLREASEIISLVSLIGLVGSGIALVFNRRKKISVSLP
ncbi:MAG: 6-pyruvoyl-tetrahydropterin synthase-related protein [Patescibacteria group bacterium]|nr:6-pyruvoyl-tetrahydropterin synthase-related protein [Patescibacteria group bacterium]